MQEDLVDIFKQVKKILKRYEDPLKPRIDLDSRYDLWSIKDVEIAVKKIKEVYFAGLIIQSSYVGFYYMPVYTDTEIEDMFAPDLLKLKTGKSCFHIKKLDAVLLKHIENALDLGYALYQKRGWI